MLRYCTRCGVRIVSEAGRSTGADATETSTDQASTSQATAVHVTTDPGGTGQVSTDQGRPGRGSPTGTTTGPAHPEGPEQPGSPPVIPAQVGVADAGSGDGPPRQPTTAWAAPAWAGPAEAPSAPERVSAPAPQGDPATERDATAHGPAERPAPDSGDWLPPPEAAPAASVAGEAEPLGLVRIGDEAGGEPWLDDPWLRGSHRPERRALVIGGVVIAGLLAITSTAWLVGTNRPQAGGAPASHLSRPSQLGSGQAQPSQAQSGQALSGHPVPVLTPTSQPAPVRTGQGSAQSGQSGPGTIGHGQSGSTPGTSPSGAGHSSTRHGTTGHSASGRSSTPHPATSPAATHRTGAGQPGSGRSGHKRTGTGRSTTTPAPHPHRSPRASGTGGQPRRTGRGIVSVGPGLADRAGVWRVAAFLERYFTAVNHRDYRAYSRLFAQRHLTPRQFAWGYQTTHDSKAVLVGLGPLKGGLKATVAFTSHQDPAGSPDHSSCIDWRITLFLHRAGPSYLIGMPPSGYRAALQACRFGPWSAARAHSGHRGSGSPGSQHQRSRHRGRKNR